MEILLLSLMAYLPFLFIGATYNGVNKAKAVDPSGENILDKGLYRGKLRMMHDTYVMTGSELALETIAMGGVLPAGARIVEVIIDTDDLDSGALTLDVGDSHLSTRYISGISSGTGAAQTSKIIVGQAIAARGYKIGTNSGDNQVLIKFATLNTPTAEGDISLTIIYTEE